MLTLPASGSAATATGASTKPAKPAATVSSTAAPASSTTPTSAAAVTASAATPCEEGKNPPAAVHAAAATAGSAPDSGAEDLEYDKQNDKNSERTDRPLARFGLARNRSGRRRARERNTFVVSNVFGQLPSGDFDRGAEIVLAEEWNHRATGITSASIIDDGFETVADFDA